MSISPRLDLGSSSEQQTFLLLFAGVQTLLTPLLMKDPIRVITFYQKTTHGYLLFVVAAAAAQPPAATASQPRSDWMKKKVSAWLACA